MIAVRALARGIKQERHTTRRRRGWPNGQTEDDAGPCQPLHQLKWKRP